MDSLASTIRREACTERRFGRAPERHPRALVLVVFALATFAMLSLVRPPFADGSLAVPLLVSALLTVVLHFLHAEASWNAFPAAAAIFRGVMNK